MLLQSNIDKQVRGYLITRPHMRTQAQVTPETDAGHEFYPHMRITTKFYA